MRKLLLFSLVLPAFLTLQTNAQISQNTDNQIPSSGIDSNNSTPDSREGGPRQVISDSAITTTIKAKLAANRKTSSLGIKVITINGIVTLSGIARNEEEKAIAGRIAANTKGVAKVSNNITIPRH